MYRLVPDRVDWRVVDGEVIALDLHSSLYLSINGTGAAIWPQLAAGAPHEALVATICKQFDVGAERASADVSAFLSELAGLDLIERDSTG